MPVLRNKSKHKGLARTFYSAKYAIEGLIYAYKNEKSLWLHAFLSALCIFGGIVLNLTRMQWIVMLIALVIILAFELINTAIEAVVDLVTLEYNELAKIAKDCAGAATFVTSIIGFIIALSIYVPAIMEYFNL